MYVFIEILDAESESRSLAECMSRLQFEATVESAILSRHIKMMPPRKTRKVPLRNYNKELPAEEAHRHTPHSNIALS
jgi:hypothetical protein